MVNEANAICDELRQPLSFVLAVRSRHSTDKDAFSSKSEVFVQVVLYVWGVYIILIT